jgi:hypothetical protein
MTRAVAIARASGVRKRGERKGLTYKGWKNLQVRVSVVVTANAVAIAVALAIRTKPNPETKTGQYPSLLPSALEPSAFCYI